MNQGIGKIESAPIPKGGFGNGYDDGYETT
jgi:hypothetical protein